MRAKAAQENGFFAREIAPVEIAGSARARVTVDRDEHPRGDTTLEALAKLRAPFRKQGGTVTAGNASGVNDGAAALIIASEEAATRHGLTPRARVVAMATAGVRAAHHGHRPGAGDAEAAGAARPEDRRHRRDRAERGVRRARASR